MFNRNNNNKNTQASHRARLFSKSVVTGAAMPLALLPFGLIGGVTHGLVRAYSRKPMEYTDIKAVVRQLCRMRDDESLDRFIESVVNAYSKSQSLASSESSYQLMSILQNSEIASVFKLAHIVGYMNNFDADNFNKNNGKKLFNIIAAEVKSMTPTAANTETRLSYRPQ